MDKSDFTKIVRTTYKTLIPVLSNYQIKPKSIQTLKIINTETDGWRVNLKNVSSLNCHLELWFDRWTAHDDRKLWYGIYSTKKSVIKSFSKNYTKSSSTYLTITDKDIDDNANERKIKLNRKLLRKSFEVPILEFYDLSKYYFFGIYEYSTIKLTDLEIEKLVERIANFFNTVLENMITVKNNSNYQDYSAIENRKKVVSHILRERNSFLTTLRKQKDNYKCQVCHANMEDIYGSLGKHYAEAHHILPLNKIKSQSKTKISDLITVCANCHRMLHRMKGDKSDIQKLKSLIKK